MTDTSATIFSCADFSIGMFTYTTTLVDAAGNPYENAVTTYSAVISAPLDDLNPAGLQAFIGESRRNGAAPVQIYAVIGGTVEPKFIDHVVPPFVANGGVLAGNIVFRQKVTIGPYEGQFPDSNSDDERLMNANIGPLTYDFQLACDRGWVSSALRKAWMRKYFPPKAER